ncbi:hypothetical protein B0J11DRAFT_585510 [Dendryphion nanum]|uniref:Uncharacterized protein n=1 Tax=Dendryphion nanum TaxID=256645 RepID=A0A9P9I9A5_9PLEO|nr:hypothetical protein B0J11DRAFT_585510 [Dendryphion nanum]
MASSSDSLPEAMQDLLIIYPSDYSYTSRFTSTLTRPNIATVTTILMKEDLPEEVRLERAHSDSSLPHESTSLVEDPSNRPEAPASFLPASDPRLNERIDSGPGSPVTRAEETSKKSGSTIDGSISLLAMSNFYNPILSIEPVLMPPRASIVGPQHILPVVPTRRLRLLPGFDDLNDTFWTKSGFSCTASELAKFAAEIRTIRNIYYPKRENYITPPTWDEPCTDPERFYSNFLSTEEDLDRLRRTAHREMQKLEEDRDADVLAEYKRELAEIFQTWSRISADITAYISNMHNYLPQMGFNRHVVRSYYKLCDDLKTRRKWKTEKR